MMLQVLLKVFGLVLLVFLLVLLLRDAVCWVHWLLKYKSQGIPFEYVPFFGMNYYYSSWIHPYFEDM